MFDLMALAMLIVGMIIGICISVWAFKKDINGYLRVDRSDEKPYLFLELSSNIENLEKKKYIMLEVKKEDFLPHK